MNKKEKSKKAPAAKVPAGQLGIPGQALLPGQEITPAGIILPVLPGSPGVAKVDGKKADLETALEVAQGAMIEKIGKEIIEAGGRVTEKYWELCSYIHANKVDRKTVSREMGKLGFKRSRISEVNRVANDEKAFAGYEAKLIGFDRALEIARMNKAGDAAEPTPAALLMEASGVLTREDVEGEVKEIEHTPPRSAKKPRPLSQQVNELLIEAAVIVAVNYKDNVPFSLWYPCKHCPSGGVLVKVLFSEKPADASGRGLRIAKKAAVVK